MAVVKLSKKDELDKLVATLTLRIGKKIPQQEVLDVCIEHSLKNIDEIEMYFSPPVKLSKERIEEIMAMGDDFDYDKKKSIDDVVYGI